MRFPVIPSIFILLLAISAAVIVPNAVVLLPEREAMAAQLSAQSGLKVALKGDMRLRFLPRPQVILQNVEAQPAENGAQSLRAETLIIDIAPLDLLQGKLRVSGISTLNADVRLTLRGGLEELLGRQIALAYPPIRLIETRLRISGLDQQNPDKQVMADNITAYFPARQIGDGLVVQASRKNTNAPDTKFTLRFATPIGERHSLHVALGFGPDEQLGFDGFLTLGQRGWRADGEVNLNSAGLLTDLAQDKLPLGLSAVSRRIAFSGLVQADATGIRTENLEINALNSPFKGRLTLDWPQSPAARPTLSGRLSTGVINLDQISFTRKADSETAAPMAAMAGLWGAFGNQLGVALRIEATRFDLGGEAGQNLLLAFDWQGDTLDVQRLSLNLPFRSLFLASGAVDLSQELPTFRGAFSTRSTDALGALLWVGEQAKLDASQLVENLDENALQRISLVGDVEWSPEALTLQALSGSLGDDRVSADIELAYRNALRGMIDVRLDRFDMVDWGIGASGGGGSKTAIETFFKPINKMLVRHMGEADAGRDVRFRFATGSAFSGANNIGPIEIDARLRDRSLYVEKMDLLAFNGLAINIDGQMNYDAKQAYGGLNVRLIGGDADAFMVQNLRNVLPFDLADDLALDLTAKWQLSGPDDADWPNSKFSGSGLFGPVQASFMMAGPSRELVFNVAGQKLDLALSGTASEIAGLVNVPLVYEADALGALQLNLENESSNVSKLSGVLNLQDDEMSLSGAVRQGASGRRIEGALDLRLANGLPLLDAQNKQDVLPMQGKVQIVSDRESLSFSALAAQLGAGTITGEGVLAYEAEAPKLNANLVADNIDLSWMLPRYGKQGWSDAAMKWRIFEAATMDVEWRGTGVKLGALTLDEIAARLKLVGGVLEAPEITGRLLGGGFSAGLVAEGGSLTPYFNLQSRFTNLNMQNALGTVYQDRPLIGAMDATLNLSGRGASVRGLMASLGGDMQLNAGAGRLAFINLDRFADLALAETFSGPALALLKQEEAAGSTDFERGVGLVEIRDGQAIRATLDFVFDEARPRREARFDGQVDFVSGDILADMNLFADLSQKKLQWQFSGKARAPKIKLDVSDFDRLVEPETSPAAPSSE